MANVEKDSAHQSSGSGSSSSTSSNPRWRDILQNCIKLEGEYAAGNVAVHAADFYAACAVESDMRRFFETNYPQIDYDASNLLNMSKLQTYLVETLGAPLPCEATLNHYKIVLKNRPEAPAGDPFYLWMESHK